MEFVLTPVIPAKAGIQRVSDKFATGNQVKIAVSGSPLPLRERARVRVSRAQARLCGRDARAPRSQTYPCKPIKGEGIRWLVFVLDFGMSDLAATVRIPAFAGMTG